MFILNAGKRKKRFFTCDKKRGNAPLTINPLDIETMETIYYLSDGTIKSTDADMDYDINIRLNLNCIELLHMWESETDPKTPYIGIAIWWLKEQIRSFPEI